MKKELLLSIGLITAGIAQAQQNPNDEWELVSLPRTINTQYHDSAPVIAPDGSVLYFTVNDHPENTKGTKGSQDIWYSKRGDNGDWQPAVHAPSPLNSLQYNQVMSVSGDGSTLLIRGGSGKNNLGFATTQVQGNNFSRPEELDISGFKRMCKGRFNGAFLAPDGNALMLYFSEKEGDKYSNLYVSFPEGKNKWSTPAPITSLNTRLDEFGPYLAPDGKTLYFSSNRGGGFGNADIYKTVRKDDTWQNWTKPENIGAPINTGGFDAYYAIGNSDTLVFTTRAYMSRDGGHLDIHTLRRVIKPEPKLNLSGIVANKKNDQPIPQASVKVLNAQDSVISVVNSGDADALYRARLPQSGWYFLEVSAEGFLPAKDSIEATLGEVDTEVYQNIYLQPLEVGLSVRLNNIFFDFDKTTLREESFPELDKVVDLMEQNPNLRIEIAGHTDDKGSDSYNETLSQGRAEAVVAYIVSNFIDQDRIIAKGYGESKPEVPNTTDENRQINRRVEFTILENKQAQASSGW